jgi:hypothetical protein
MSAPSEKPLALLVPPNDCGPGWQHIIDALIGRIEFEMAHLDMPPVEILQIKEKLGSLRVHVHGGNERTRALIEMAIAVSEHVCAESGLPRRLNEDDKNHGNTSSSASLGCAEIHQLWALNQRLVEITQHLNAVAADVTPRLLAKLADPHDPMYDYEIEVRLDYVLRGDDPEYKKDDDNFLCSRKASLKLLELLNDDFFDPVLSGNVCWLFHDLKANRIHDFEVSPRLLRKDCLRVGSVLVDVQVWQQYEF